jgi:hypothetical protein
MKSKLVKYEQRLKTNRCRLLEKQYEKWNIASNRQLFKTSDLFFESIYEEVTKKTKLKIKIRCKKKNI